MRHDSRVINKAAYLAIGVSMDGIKEVLGMWTAENEGAKFWLQVVTELKNRGVKTYSLPAWTDSRDSPKQLSQFSLKPKFSFV